MITPFDDYPIHQTSLPLAIPATSDRNFYDRFWLNGFVGDGSLYFGAAMGFYPYMTDIAQDAHAGGLHFRLSDRNGAASVPVVYKGSVPDLFKTGREVVVDGTLRGGVFVAVPNTLVTKCPSKYTPKKS